MNPLKLIAEYYIRKLPHKGKRHTVKWLLHFLPFKYIRSYYGPILSCNPKDKTNVYGICGEYGHVIQDHIQTIPNDSVFIDIGTNYGVFSLLAAKLLTHGKVFSFEPNPYVYGHFIKGITLNDAKNVTPFHCAIAEENSLLNLSFNPNHSGLSHISENADDITVPAFNIAHWDILNSELNTNNEIHIKIDVEGYEFGIINVLRQAQWYKNITSLVVEIDEKNLKLFNTDAETLYSTLKKDGFTPSIGLDTSKHYDEIFTKQV